MTNKHVFLPAWLCHAQGLTAVNNPFLGRLLKTSLFGAEVFASMPSPRRGVQPPVSILKYLGKSEISRVQRRDHRFAFISSALRALQKAEQKRAEAVEV